MSGSKVVWGFFKWLVIPAGMALVGYYFIGPKINYSDVLVSQASKVKGLVEGATESKPIEVDEGEKGRHSKVDLTVTIEKDDGKRSSSGSSSSSRGSGRKSSYFRSQDEPAPEPERSEGVEPPATGSPDTGGW